MLRTSMSGDYVAPEVMRLLGDDEENFNYSNAVDMWSLGCMTSWLLTTLVPFPHGRGLLKYCRREKTFPSDVLQSTGHEAFDFVQKVMAIDPNNRLSAEQSLQHTWLKQTSEVPPLDNKSYAQGDALDGLKEAEMYEARQHIRIQPVAQAQHPTAHPVSKSPQYKQPKALVTLPRTSHHVSEVSRIEDSSKLIKPRRSEGGPDGATEYYGSPVSLMSKQDIQYISHAVILIQASITNVL